MSLTIIMDFKAVKYFILRKLQTELPSGLYYHGIHHTMDVLKAVEEISASELEKYAYQVLFAAS